MTDDSNVKFVIVDAKNSPNILGYDFIPFENLSRKPIEGEQTVVELSKSATLTEQEAKILDHLRSGYHLHIFVGLTQYSICNCRDDDCWHKFYQQILIVKLPSYFSLDAVQEDGTFFDENLKRDIMANFNCKLFGDMKVVKKPCVKTDMMKFLNELK